MITLSGYKKIELIYEGSCSHLFRATELESGQQVVLKTPAHRPLTFATYRQYQQTFTLAQMVQHPQVITYKAILSTTENVVLVLEYFESKPLSRIVSPDGLEIGLFFTIVEQLLLGIKAIHNQRIFHTAINPQNILFDEATSALKIIDFSKATQLTLPSPKPQFSVELLREEADYWAPEQLGQLAAPIDHRADLYAVGIVSYELLTGKRPPDKKHISPPHTIKETIPEMLSQWVMQLLSFDVEDRYPHCENALTDLLICQEAWQENGRIPQFTLKTERKPTEHPDEKELMDVLAASQALSSEVDLHQLLTKLMHIVIEETNAECGHLILRSNKNLRIAASVYTTESGIKITQPMSVPQSDNLACSFIEKALQTKQALHFSKGNRNNSVHPHEDPYVQNKDSLSVLCLPIQHKEKTTGVLYLESQQEGTVFLNKEIEILQFLAAQTAISLENAYLYEDLNQTLIQHERTEQKLKTIDERFKIAMETGSLGIWDWDIRSNVITWSDHVEKLFGMKQGEFDGKYETYLSLIHPDDIAMMEETITKALADPTFNYHVVHRLIWPNGEAHWLEGSGKVYRDHQEQPLHMTGYVMDITERKKREMVEREREVWLERVLELGKTITAVIDWDQCLQTLHQCVQEGLEFERVGTYLYDEETQMIQGAYGTSNTGEREDTSWYLLNIQDDPGFADVMKSPKGFQFYEDLSQAIERDEGHEMYGVREHATIAVWAGEKPIAAIAVDNGITHKPIKASQIEALRLFASYAGFALETAQLLDQLSQQKEQLQLALNAAQMGTWNWDIPKGKVTWTEQVNKLHGFPPQTSEQISNRNLWSKIHRDDKKRLLEILNKVQEVNETSFRTDYRVPLQSGDMRWLEVTGKRINDSNGNPIRISGTIIDITARKQAEIEKEQLIEELEARNAELERFTYTVSHDLKSPLITIRGFLGLLERDIERNNQEKVARDMERIHAAAGRMLILLDDLLELSRIGRLTNPPTAVSINTLAEEATELVAGRIRERGVQVIVEPNCPSVYVDKPRLVEVFQNLIDNSVKFMGEQPSPTIEIGTRVSETEIVCFIKDNGIGIDPRYLERIFNLFERLDPSIEGTGIGLALIKRIIEFHNGRIWAESEGEGQGTTFLFTLPPVISANAAHD